MNRNKTPPAIEFTITDKKLRYKYVGLDDHRGNFMRCPITGHIFPTDALLFD